MQSRMHGRRRRRIQETPWLLIATVIGIIIVAGAAFTYFTSPGSHVSSSQAISQKTAVTTTTATTVSPVQTTTFSFVKPTTASVPASGVSIGVNYLGGFNGSYSTGGITTKITPNSGSQTYQVANATGSVTAVFQKTDETVTHALTITIYKNGKQLATNSSSLAYGKVIVTASV